MITKRQIRLAVLFVFTSTLTLGWIGANDLFAGSCCSSSGAKSKEQTKPSGNTRIDSATQHHQTAAAAPFRAPRGGQLSKTIWNYYEVVYGPQETRIYLYDMFRGPVSVRGIQGQAFLRVRSNGGQYRYPLEYVQPSEGQDYLVMRVDLTRVRDHDMDVYFDVANLPNRVEPSARIAQVFARPQARPAIAVIDAVAADWNAVQHQQTCPIMNTRLGEHGTPVKVSINKHPLFVCCRGCVDSVAQNPNFYLKKVATGQGTERPLLNRLPMPIEHASSVTHQTPTIR